MALVVTANSTSVASLLIDDRGCLSLGSVGDVATYANSGYVGMRGNQFSTPNAVAADVTQLVVSFPAAADAQGLLQRARQDWRGCANRRYGFTRRTATTVSSTPGNCAAVARASNCRCAKKKIPGGAVRTR
jgi:PknH-like extracellular domain